MGEVTFEVVKKIAVLSESPRGWTKELRLIDWNSRGPRFDLREWGPGDRQFSRGITLTVDEVWKLRDVLNEREQEESE